MTKAQAKLLMEHQQQLIDKLNRIEKGGDLEGSQDDIEDAIMEYFEVTAPKVALALEEANVKASSNW